MNSKFRLFQIPRPTTELYDVIVVGAGPAGLTSAIYLARYKLKVLVVSDVIGGTVNEAPLIDDYPGIPEITGADLAKRFADHVRKYEVPIVVDHVVDIVKEGDVFTVVTKSGSRYRCHAVILAVGLRRRKLGIPGEDRLLGKGVSYCVTCDIPLFKNRVVAVIGGGNSALIGAIHASRYASKVYLVHRRREFRALPIYIDMVMSNPKIELVLNVEVEEIVGNTHVEALILRDKETGSRTKINVDGVFIEIGFEPPTEFFKRLGLAVDDEGRVLVDVNRMTSIEGIFAAGTCCGGHYRYKFDQVIVAAADGAIAADAVFRYLLQRKLLRT